MILFIHLSVRLQCSFYLCLIEYLFIHNLFCPNRVAVTLWWTVSSGVKHTEPILRPFRCDNHWDLTFILVFNSTDLLKQNIFGTTSCFCSKSASLFSLKRKSLFTPTAADLPRWNKYRRCHSGSSLGRTREGEREGEKERACYFAIIFHIVLLSASWHYVFLRKPLSAVRARYVLPSACCTPGSCWPFAPTLSPQFKCQAHVSFPRSALIHLVVLQTSDTILPSLPPFVHPYISVLRAHTRSYNIPPYREASHPALLRGRYYDSILNIVAEHKRPQPVTDQPPVTSTSWGGSNAEQHGRGAIPQHMLDGWGKKKKKPPRSKTAPISTEADAISHFDTASHKSGAKTGAEWCAEGETVKERGGGYRKNQGYGGEMWGVEGWQTMVTQFVSAG